MRYWTEVVGSSFSVSGTCPPHISRALTQYRDLTSAVKCQRHCLHFNKIVVRVYTGRDVRHCINMARQKLLEFNPEQIIPCRTRND